MVQEILESITDFSPLVVLGLGLVIGLEHAFEPDHVAAVGTQVSKVKSQTGRVRNTLGSVVKKSSILGALWGAGHTTTLVLIGLLVYVMTIQIQVDIFSGLEFIVGIMLVFLGITTVLNKRHVFRLKHKHPHQHNDGTIHFDEHTHNDSNHRHGHKSYVIGLVHGLAGSGSLVVLTATTLSNPGMILGFILVFGIGSILGMVIVSSLIGLPFAAVSRISSIHRIFRYAAGAFSCVLGANIMYEIGMLDNIFHIF